MMVCPVCHESLDMKLTKKDGRAVVVASCGCTKDGKFSKTIEKGKR